MKSAAELALISLLAKHNWVANRVLPRWAYVPYGLASSVAAAALSRRGGATLAELGLERERIGDGVRVGAITSTVAAAAIATGVAIPATRRFYADDRVVHPHGVTLAYEVGVRIPVGTAVVEEVLFRSALLGLLLHQRSWVSSAAWSSALFGVWHVLPAMATISDSAALTGMSGRVGRAGAVAGAVVATTVGGIVFAELRRRSGSVVAPILLHATVNVAAFAAARWSRTREGNQLSPATTRPDSYATTTA